MDQHSGQTAVVGVRREESNDGGAPLREISSPPVDSGSGFPEKVVLGRRASEAFSTTSDDTSTTVTSELDRESFDESVASESDSIPNGSAGGTGGGGGGGAGDGTGGGGGADDGGGGTRSIRQKRDLSESSSEQEQQQQQQQPNGQRLRKACDLCTKRKRKCNGKQPCSQCIETGAPNQCIYSPRLKSGRKKKVRIDGVLYEEGAHGGGLALVASAGTGRHSVDPSAGRFSASGAVGLAGHVENYFLATYLRDFNRVVPLTTESIVTEGMLEVLSPAVSSRGLATANPIKQSESRRQAKLAVFWGVVAMGSRILGASDESTMRYLGLMRTALKECFDSNDKEVVQAYLLLSTVETMRGNEAAGKRYLDHAHTMHNGNAMGPAGELLKDRSEQDVSMDLVFQIFDQPDGCPSGHSRSVAAFHRRRRDSNGKTPPAGGGASSEPSSAVDQMIAQAMSPPSDSQSSPVKALKYLSTACGLSSEVFDPTNKCVTVKQYIAEMDSALKGAHSIFVATDLGECITGVMMVKIWGGVTVLMRSWGKPDDKDLGLAQVEEGVGYALTRPGLFTFPLWWHALHSASATLAHFGRRDTYMRLRETFNKHTFPGTEMPSFEDYTPGSICPLLNGSCSKLAYWLQVRGTMCGSNEWKPQFANGHLSEDSENAAYAVALERAGGARCEADPPAETNRQPEPEPLNGADLMDGSPVRAALSAGLNEISAQLVGGRPLQATVDVTEMGTHLDDLSNLGILGATDPDLDPLGVEFDLSQLPQEPVPVGSMGTNGDPAEPALQEYQDIHSAALPTAMGVNGVPMSGEGAGGRAVVLGNAMQVPASLVGRGGVGGADAGAASNGGGVEGAPGISASGAGVGSAVVVGGGELSRGPSFGISGPAAVSSMLGGGGGSWAGASSPGDFMNRQSSIDINTIMQMATSDEQLKKNEGVEADAMDTALAFGEGPAKELFGVELSSE